MVLVVLLSLAQIAEETPLGRFPAAATGRSYVGSETCGGCHADHAVGQQAHHMALTARAADEDDPLFAETLRSAPVEWPSGIAGPSTPPAPDEVSAVLGSGIHGVTPIRAEPGRRIRELPLSYSELLGAWFPTPGIEGREDLVAGSLKSEETSLECLSCHATTLAWKDDVLDPERTRFGVQCERCHGPGSAHVDAVTRGTGESAILNPELLTGAEQVRFCAQCHRFPVDFEPLEVLGRAPMLARHAAAGLMMSACFRASPANDTITCTGCHDPHRNIEAADATRFQATCLGCHQEPGSRHRYERVDRSSDCVGCHMPVETQGFHGMSFTDHWIRVPGARPPLGTNAEKDTLDYLEILYRNEWEETGERPERRAHLALGLAEVAYGLGRTDDALSWLSESLAAAPSIEERLKASAMLREAGKPDAAADVLEGLLEERPDLLRARFDLGQIARERGEAERALAHFDQVVRDRPDFAEAQAARAAVLTELRRYDDALAGFRDAQRLEPSDPATLAGLARVLATHPDASRRDPEEAVSLAERAATATGYVHPVVLDALGAAYAAAGEFDSAVGAARRAEAIASEGGALALAEEIRARLALYLEERPFIAPEGPKAP